MPELDVGSIVLRIRADASGIAEGARVFSSSMAKMQADQGKLTPALAKLEKQIAITAQQYRVAAEEVSKATTAHQDAINLYGKESAEAQKAAKALREKAEAMAFAKEAMSHSLKAGEDIAKTNQQIVDSAEEAAEATKKLGDAGAVGYAVVAAAAAKMLSTVLSAVDNGINAINKFRAALIGLGSVAAGRGVGSEAMENALDGLTDAFLDAGSAATALKNLLSRGYNLDEAVKAITQLKDAAAFGRQGQLSLGEAVVTATEGIRNQNSILVDNAGVTKNLRTMHEEYAESLGKTVAQLTQQEMIQAEIAGLTRETAHQTGDLAKLQNTLAGEQARTAKAGEDLARAYGASMSPAVSLVNKLFGEFLGTLESVVKQAPAASAGLTGIAVSIGLFSAVSGVAVAVSKFGASLKAAAAGATLFGTSLKAALPILGLVTVAVGAATAAYTHFSNEKEEARKRAEEFEAQLKEEQQARDANIQSLKSSTDELRRLGARYDELAGKTTLAYNESQELLEIERRLNSEFQITGSALDGLAGKYGTYAEAIKEATRAKLAEQTPLLQENVTKAYADYSLKNLRSNQANEALVILERIKTLNSEIADLTAQGLQGGGRYAQAKEELKQLNEEFARSKVYQEGFLDEAALRRIAGEGAEGIAAYFKANMELISNQVEISGVELGVNARAAIDRMFMDMAKANPNMGSDQFDRIFKIYSAALRNADISEAVDAMAEINGRILTGGAVGLEDISKVTDSWSSITDFVTQMGSAMGMSADEIKNAAAKFAPVMAPIVAQIDNLADAPARLIESWKTANMSKFMNAPAEELKAALDEMAKDTKAGVDTIINEANRLRSEKDIKGALEALINNFGNEGSWALEQAKDTLKAYGVEVPESLEGARKAFEHYTAFVTDSTNKVNDSVEAMVIAQGLLREYQNSLLIAGRGDTAEYADLEAQIQRMEQAISAAQRDLGHGGFTLISPEQRQEMELAEMSAAQLTDRTTQLGNAARAAREEVKQHQETLQALAIVQQGLQTGDTTSALFTSSMEYLRGLTEFHDKNLDSITVVNQAISEQTTLLGAARTGAVGLSDSLKEVAGALQDAKTGDPFTDAGIDTAIVKVEQFLELTAKIAEGADFSNFKFGAEETADAMNEVNEALDRFDAGMDDAATTSTKLQKLLDKVTKEAEDLNKELSRKVPLADKYREIQRIANAQQEGKASAKEWAWAQKEAAEHLNLIGSNAQTMAEVAGAAFRALQSEISNTSSRGAGLVGVLNRIVSASSIRGSVSINTSPAIAALKPLINILNVVRKIFGLPALSLPGQIKGGGSSSGGGGGVSESPFSKDLKALVHDVRMGRLSLEQELNRLNQLYDRYRHATGKSALTDDERRDLAERIYDTEQEIKKRALDAEYRSLEHRKSLNQISITQEIAALERIAQAHRLSNEERMELDEKLHDARERLRSDRLKWDLGILDHNKAMGRLTVEQEIGALEQIKEAHRLKEEELRDIEERLYSLRTSLVEKAADKERTAIQRAYKAITEALRASLNEEKAAHLQRIDDRIAALDKITQAENEQQRKSEYEATLADKRRMLAVTKSARERRALMAEIERMEAAEALRQRQLSRQDEKDALNAEKKAVQERYQELTSEENIRQEALRLVMSSNLQQMTDLIASYGNQWQDAGASLAEHLMEGIEGSKHRITQSLQSLVQTMEQAVKGQLSMAGASVPNFGSAPPVQVIMNGLTIREEADIRKLAAAMNTEIQRARR